MRDKVLRRIEADRLLEQGDTVIVALSGGADSTALLHLLISIKELYHLTVYAAHFNHRIRGAEADRDERFCRELCDRLGVELFTAGADVPAIADEAGESLELCGRKLRYRFFDELTGRIPGAKIATAHHRSDNTETVLMNLIRGTGLAGMAGIPVKRPPNLIRPLLSCSRAEIEAYCRENVLEYVTDSTNLDDAYTRNRLRLKILPAMRELNPSLDESILRMSALVREADEYLDKISKEELKKSRNAYGYRCPELLKLDRVILTFAVKNVVEEAGAPVDSQHIALIIDAMRAGGSVDLGGGYRAVCAQGVLRIIDGGAAADSDFCVPVGVYCTRRFTAEECRSLCSADNHENIHKLFLQNCIPCGIITDDTVVRHRRAGDTFTDPRRGLTKTLKKLLNELKIPREKRDSLIVVAHGSTVLWIEGIGTSKQARIPENYNGEVYFFG